VALVFCCCGTKEEYPVLEAVSLEGKTLAAGEYDTITASYEESSWQFTDTLGVFMTHYIPTLQDAFKCNINIIDTGENIKELTPKMIDEINSQQKNMLAENGINVLSEEKMMFDGQLINVLETETKVTNESIDLLIEQGNLTEEMIDSLGGREVFINSSSCRQTMYYLVVDTSLIIITGSYDIEGSNKAAVLEQMNIFMQTARIK